MAPPGDAPAAHPASAADLLRGVGLLADGPTLLGRPVRASGPGVYLVELERPLASAPIDAASVGTWLVRVPGLKLDGEPPTSRRLAARLSAFWIPSARVVFIGGASGSVGGRVMALVRHVLGDRQPHASAQWLKTLRVGGLRVWWAATDAPEEYEDALLDAFAASVPVDERAALHDPDLVLPFANLRNVTGEAKRHGLSGSVLPAEPVPTPPPARVVELPPGDAEGSRPEAHGTGTTRRTNRSALGAAPRRPAIQSRTTPATTRPPAEPVYLSTEGEASLRAELEELVSIRRPEVIDRVRSARQLGDLRENAEYHAAREEQSFLEGRIQTIEAHLRSAVVAERAEGDQRAAVGSRVTVERDGERHEFSIVGARESDPSSGRISYASPVGQALVGRSVGDEAVVRTPGGEVRYLVVAIE